MGGRVHCDRAAIVRALFSSLFAAPLLFGFSSIAEAQAPGGLFVGYYHEDPVTNPEDPFPGALYLNLPSADGTFGGTMFFTYFGCQKVSAGSISGSKNQLSLSGRWSGPVDNTFQAGSFSGTYGAATQRYTGTYTVDGGKQFVDLRPCVQYYIAPNGTWEASPVGVSVPGSFAVLINGSRVSWSPTSGTAFTLIAIIDQSLATSASTSAVKWQTLFMSPFTITDLSAFGQTLGPNDVVTVATFDSLGRRIAFGSKATSTTAPPPPNPPPAVLNFQGLFYNAPAESEAGWGINFAHQGDVIFATWFTYGATGRAWWLTMTAEKTGTNTYTGKLYETRGPAFNAVPFSPSAVQVIEVGDGTLNFADVNNGSFRYTVNGITQTKTLVRQVFGPVPGCSWGAQSNLALAVNYQDLWWASPPPGVESGWGVNFTHQGDIIFATWFTYDFDGKPLWLSATVRKGAAGVYTGAVYRTTGPAFSAQPWDKSTVTVTQVGDLTITFANGNAATFHYTLALGTPPAAVDQTKLIERQVLRVPGTVCQ